MYAPCYSGSVQVTITHLRQDLFKLVERALEGEPVQFEYKGVTFTIAPESKPSKLSRLVRQEIVPKRASLKRTSRALMKEMRAEWEKDWSEL